MIGGTGPRRLLAALGGPGRRATWRRHALRRLAAAVLAGVAVWVGLGLLTPGTGEPGRLVVTSTTDLPVGHRVGPNDIQLRRVADSGVPGSVLVDPGACIGRVTTTTISAGEVLTAARISTPAALAVLGPTHRAVHLPLADPASAVLVRAGDRVDVIGVGDGRVVASDLIVMAVDQRPEDAGALGLTPAASSGVVVSVPVSHVGALTRAALGDTPMSGVHLALRPVSSLS